MNIKIKSLYFLLLSILILSGCTSKESEKQSDKSIFKETMIEMTWKDVKKEAERGSVVLFPISVVEEHGPHMDLSPDIYLTYYVCVHIKHNLQRKGIRAIIAPPYYWGINQATGEFPGSFTVKPETFKAMLSDSIECLKSWGFAKVFCANLHGDSLHKAILQSSIIDIQTTLGIDVYDIYTLDVKIPNPPAFPPTRSGKYNPDYHAGANETSQMWFCYPDKVNIKLAKKLNPQSNFYPLGYIGDPAKFDLEKGGEVLNTVAEYGALAIEAFLKQQKK